MLAKCGGKLGTSADSLARAKTLQALKLAEIRNALIKAGYRSAGEQAKILGVGRSTAWALLNRNKRTGPSSVVLKHILSSPDLPPAVRHKIEEFIDDKIAGRYGHREIRRRWFRDQFSHILSAENNPGRKRTRPLGGDIIEQIPLTNV